LRKAVVALVSLKGEYDAAAADVRQRKQAKRNNCQRQHRQRHRDKHERSPFRIAFKADDAPGRF
jgi:hypothetical protein